MSEENKFKSHKVKTSHLRIYFKHKDWGDVRTDIKIQILNPYNQLKDNAAPCGPI